MQLKQRLEQGIVNKAITEIKRKEADGIIIFQGMQDHTADSIKSLEAV